ncbi:MAG: response regulator [Spirochaetes bacterium GWD1_61_31]|nr:MAG: response regulator [Spirochaetes bacterium GWB1_60_80]OHD28545.1 MAG: response regulator [Spirochaetes bacterium GWC1_61_12]OHD42642.1 MAG: response regulator [Spirochaetes bacterium GWD1_61_31]OHD44539.1 MAG: response regulator [Spirochaetes bacterium GWE1_60_18]OHD58672.1 MAG: response regulator [Spirochaetes bacterium GWF1_60_12]HAP43194.1 response regulator [Spirochaetaceae bacterium]
MARPAVLIIDESDLFRDYLKNRLLRAGLAVEVAINGLDGLSKMRKEPPELIIMDYHLSRKTAQELLQEKAKNPNTADIPVMLTAHKLDKNRLLDLLPFNIKKIFMKPLKLDIFLQTVAEVTGVRFDMDKTPCIVEAHVNDNILFIELAMGLNRDKIDLLRFKIKELIDLYSIQKPKVILMLSDMELSFVDGANLELLLNTIIAAASAKSRSFKILTLSGFVQEFVAGRAEYAGVEVVKSLEYAIDGLIAEAATAADLPEDKAAIISEKVLNSSGAKRSETVTMRFDTEQARAQTSPASLNDLGRDLEIAAVDDDFVIQELIKTTFASLNAKVSTFNNGRVFLEATEQRSFDLVFLDLRMPQVNGFEVLSNLHARDLQIPIIVLSAITQREAVVKAYRAGVKSYLVKPLKPQQILTKTLEILKANF